MIFQPFSVDLSSSSFKNIVYTNDVNIANNPYRQEILIFKKVREPCRKLIKKDYER